MPSSGVDMDLEAQGSDARNPTSSIHSDSPPTHDIDPQLPASADFHTQVTNAEKHHAPRPADNSYIQRHENHGIGDSSDGLWSMYLSEAEKEDKEVTENWKGDTDGILVFSGLFSVTVAAFTLESLKKLSPNPSDTTNALLTQISFQLVNASNGMPQASIAAQSGQPFKPTASAIRVNVLWFLSLFLSLNCALSATLVRQWAQRYKELAQHRGASHRRGLMRAYLFDGLSKFGLARVVATIPTLLHISVSLFFAGLLDLLFPIQTTVAYTTLGYVGVSALIYAILTVLPNMYLNCPYGTPFSGFTWRISQFFVFGVLWTVLKIEGLLLKSWSLANRHVTGPHRLKTWREKLDKQVKMHREWLSQGLRKCVELGAYRAESTVVTSALERTLTSLDEDKEIEDFAARVPGFFNSRTVPDATSAVLSLMSHQPNTDPIFGSRLHGLLKTCMVGPALLDENLRKNRLRVCVNCLWYFGRAYNQPGMSQPLPSYFLNSLIPEITRHIQAEDDTALRVVGRCVTALTVNKLAADINSRNVPVSDTELELLSTILGTRSYDVRLLLSHPGAIEFTNLAFFALGDFSSLVTDKVPLDTCHVLHQTLGILSQALPAGLSVISQTDTLGVSNGTSPLTVEAFKGELGGCMKTLWRFIMEHNEPKNEASLPSYLSLSFANPEMTRRIHQDADLATRMIGRCIGALVVNKLAHDAKFRSVPVGDTELACLSAILGTESHDVMICFRQPGAIELVNLASLALGDISSLRIDQIPPEMRPVLQQTLRTLSKALPVREDAELPETVTPIDVYNDFEHSIVSRLHGLLNICIRDTSSLAEDVRRSCQRMCLRSLWNCVKAYHQTSDPLPSYFPLVLAKQEFIRHFQTEKDPVIHVTGCCFGALVVSKLVDALQSPIPLDGHPELACISAILGTEHREVILLPHQLRVINFRNIVSLTSGEIDTLFTAESIPSEVLGIVQGTLYILANRLRDSISVPGNLPVDERRLLQEIFSDIVDALQSDLFKAESFKTLNRLRRILEKLQPTAVE